MSDMLDQQLGSYRLTRLLGRGGYAEVYLGEHVRLDSLAAVKVLRTHLSDEDSNFFQEEAKIVAKLVHPHVIRVLDYDVKDGRPYLVLDYAPNGSLRQRHARGSRVPLAQVVSYVLQVAGALQFAHDSKLIHRDIKPENMLIGRHGEILLSDFGVAAIAHATASMHVQDSLGTIPYMAPEQIQGKPRPASDQYALAVVVHQWLSGAMPFQGTTTEVIAQHLSIEAPLLSTLVPEIAPAVAQVVTKALAKDPKERFEHIIDFARALAQAAGVPIVTGELVSGKVDDEVKMVAQALSATEAARTSGAVITTRELDENDNGLTVRSSASNSGGVFTPSLNLTPVLERRETDAVERSGEKSAGAQQVVEQQEESGENSAVVTLSRQQEGKFVFRQGLIFGALQAVVNAITCAAFWYVMTMMLPQTDLNAMTIILYLSLLALVLALIISFFTGMQVGRLTGKIRAGVRACLWVSVWNVVSSVVITGVGVLVLPWLQRSVLSMYVPAVVATTVGACVLGPLLGVLGVRLSGNKG